MSSNVLHGYGIFSRVPLIIHVFRYLDDIYPVLDELVAGLGVAPEVTFLVTSAWSLLSQVNSPALSEMARKYADFRHAHPGASVVYLANDGAEASLYKQLGFESVLFQHNAFLQPRKYQRRLDVGRQFNAIYVARIERYKRVELMEALEGAALACAGVDIHYYQAIKQRIAKVRILNGEPGSAEFRVLDHMDALDAIQSADVGLCLSAVEGAMFGSAEYLLRGTPVVSTYSIGGRDAFASDRYWLFCADDADSVRRAVEEMQRRAIPREEIAAHTKLTIMDMRVRLASYLWSRDYGAGAKPNALLDRLLDIESDYVWTATPVGEVLGGL